MTAKTEVYCCKGCGRDTTRRGGYCIDCGGRPGEHSSRGQCRRKDSSTIGEDPADFEDRFDDESGPNDVCDDGGIVDFHDEFWFEKIAREERRSKK
jgi:hypothetical protein